MAWKNFQNGYPLYASELNNYLMNQSVVVFASAAERDSVLTAPTEGQVVWLQDTNAFKIYNGTIWTDVNDNTDAIQKSLLTTAGDTIYATGSAAPARLALGSTGSVMKSNGSSPTWLAPGTSGKFLKSTGTDITWDDPIANSMVLLSTTTLSGTSTTVSPISQSYKHLWINVTGVAFTGTCDLTWNVNGSSNTFFVSGYYDVATGSGVTGAGSGTYGQMAGTFNNPLPDLYVLNLNIFDYSSAKAHTSQFSAHYPLLSGQRRSMIGNSVHMDTAAIDSFTFAKTGANNFTGGTIKIYGVN